MSFATNSNRPMQAQGVTNQRPTTGQQQGNYSAYSQNQNAQQQWQQSLNAWQMPRQDILQWGRQQGAQFQAPGTQNTTTGRPPFQQNVQSPFGNQQNWMQGRDAFMAAGYNQAATNPVGYFDQPRPRNDDWSPQNMMGQSQQLMRQGWQNPFTQPQFQAPQFDPNQDYTRPLFGPGGWNQQPQPPLPPAGPQPPATPQRQGFNPQAISQLFQNAGIQAPAGFMDQLIAILGGQQQPGIPRPPLRPAEPPATPRPPSTGTPYTGPTGYGDQTMQLPNGQTARIYTDENGRQYVNGESLAGPGEWGRTVMVPVDQINRGSPRPSPGSAQPIPPQSQGDAYGDVKKKPDSTAVAQRQSKYGESGPGLMSGATWQQQEAHWKNPDALTQEEKALAALSPAEAQVLGLYNDYYSRRRYDEAVRKGWLQGRWTNDSDEFRRVLMRNHARTYGDDQTQSAAEADYQAEINQKGFRAAPDAKQYLHPQWAKGKDALKKRVGDIQAAEREYRQSTRSKDEEITALLERLKGAAEYSPEFLRLGQLRRARKAEMADWRNQRFAELSPGVAEYLSYARSRPSVGHDSKTDEEYARMLFDRRASLMWLPGGQASI